MRGQCGIHCLSICFFLTYFPVKSNNLYFLNCEHLENKWEKTSNFFIFFSVFAGFMQCEGHIHHGHIGLQLLFLTLWTYLAASSLATHCKYKSFQLLFSVFLHLSQMQWFSSRQYASTISLNQHDFSLGLPSFSY